MPDTGETETPELGETETPETPAPETLEPFTEPTAESAEPEDQTSADVGQWKLYEIVLTSSATYSNPFTGVDVYADFSSQNRQMRVYGFHDGNGQGGQGNLWKIRFMTGDLGTWTWKTTSTDTKNTGLHNKSGELRVVASSEPGPIKPDPASPNSWLHANGEHFYWNLGYSIHVLGADRTHPGVGGWQDYLNRLEQLRFNGVMFTLQVPSFKACSTCWKGVAPWSAIGNNPAPKYAYNNGGMVDYFVMPWSSKDDPNSTAKSGGSTDYSRFYLPLWHKLDQMLAEMQSKRMVANIFPYDDETFWPSSGSAEERLYWNYILRRTGAFWNVAYNDGIDLNEYRDLRSWVPEWQNYFNGNDPFQHPRSSRHGNDDSSASVWRSVQAANSVKPSNIEEWRSVMKANPRKPVTEDDGIRARKDSGISPDRFMQLAWWSVLSGPGGFGATWAGAFEPGNWYSNMNKENEGMLRVSIRNKFLLGEAGNTGDKVPFWKLEVSDNLVSGQNVYCSSVKGEYYLVYFDSGSPTSTQIDLRDVNSRLTVTWLNPVTGAVTRANSWEPGMPATFSKPFNGPAVLALSGGGSSVVKPAGDILLFIPMISH